jgi:hypothetical protein
MTLDQKNALLTKLTQASNAIQWAPAVAHALLQEACALLQAVPVALPAQQMTPQQLAEFDKTGRLPSSH